MVEEKIYASQAGRDLNTAVSTGTNYLEDATLVFSSRLQTHCTNNSCRCACHSSPASSLKTPISRTLKPIFSALFIGYTGRPNLSTSTSRTQSSNNCDNPYCTAKLPIVHTFPFSYPISAALHLHLQTAISLTLTHPPLRAPRRVRLDPGTLLYAVYQGDSLGLRNILIADRTQLRDVTSQGGYPALSLALNSQRPHPAVLRLLLRAGADPDYPDDTGTTPRILASIATLAPWLTNFSPDFRSALSSLLPLSHGQYLEDDLGLTYLHKVALSLHPFSLSHALRQRPLPAHLRDQVNALDACFLSPLMLAASQHDLEGVTALLDAGADPNLRATVSGTTALFYALGGTGTGKRSFSPRSTTATVAALLAAGTDPNARDSDGYTPLSQAALAGNTPAVKLLLDAGARASLSEEEMKQGAAAPITYAIHANSVDVTRLMLDHGGESILFQDHPGGRTLVYLAVEENRHECLEFLLRRLLDDEHDHHIDGGKEHRSQEGRIGAVIGAIATGYPLWPTLLHIAAALGDARTFKILAGWTAGWQVLRIPPGILLGVENSRGQTPRMVFEARRDTTDELVVAFARLLMAVCGERRGNNTGRKRRREEEGEGEDQGDETYLFRGGGWE